MHSQHSHRFSSSWLRMSNSCGCMLLMDWKSESTALSLVMLRPRMWLLFMRLRKVVTAFCRAFRNCSWFSSDSPFWYCCWRRGRGGSKAQKVICGLPMPVQLDIKAATTTSICSHHKVSTYLHYVDWLDRDMSFYRLTDWWKGLSQRHRGRGWGGGTLASFFLFLLPVCSVQVTGQLE